MGEHADLKGMPQMSLGDVIDRISILALKIYFGEENAIQEFTYLTETLTDAGYDGAFIAAIMRLAQTNHMVWVRENAFRGADNPEVFEAEDVRTMMIEVRDINKKRISYKNEINRLTEKGFREFKIKHRSQ